MTRELRNFQAKLPRWEVEEIEKNLDRLGWTKTRFLSWARENLKGEINLMDPEKILKIDLEKLIDAIMDSTHASGGRHEGWLGIDPDANPAEAHFGLWPIDGWIALDPIEFMESPMHWGDSSDIREANDLDEDAHITDEMWAEDEEAMRFELRFNLVHEITVQIGYNLEAEEEIEETYQIKYI